MPLAKLMITFIYFDIGGVAIRDFSKTNKYKIFMSEIGIPEEKETGFMSILEKYDTSINLDRDIDSLQPLISQSLHLSFPQGFSLLEEFVKRFMQNRSIWPAVDKAKKNGKIGLLTNMYPRMLSKIQEANLLPPVLWDTVIDSSKVGVEKPWRGIYELAQKKADTDNEQILFIDNKEENLAIPKELGWTTYLYDPGNYEESSRKLLDFFDHIGVR